MAIDEYDDDCPGCRPAIVDVETGKVMSPDDPVMRRMMEIWANTTLPQRRAYHRVMCLNSRDPLDLVVVQGIIGQLQESSPSPN